MKLPIRLFILCLAITGCKVGPDYTPPTVFVPEQFTEDRPLETALIGDEDLVQWWCIFNDPFLNRLLDIAINQNFDYRIALEQVCLTRSQYWIQFTQILPEIDAQSVDSRFRTSRSFASAATEAAANIPQYQSFFQAGLDAIWEIDLFGKLRRSADAAFDLWQASVEDVRAIKIIVISEVANTYAAICAYQTKVDIASQIVALDRELLVLSQTRLDAGLADKLEVENVIAILESDQALLSIAKAALKQRIYSLGILLGELPEDIIADFHVERPIPRSEGKVPVVMPADLLRRRPDIRSAERQLAAATEQIGVAIAELYPSVSLTGSSSSFAANPLQGANFGVTADRFNRLFRPESLIWGYGAFITLPVFDFGKRCAAIDVQVAYRNQTYYYYQKAVIAALQETEQALETFFNDEAREKSLSREVDANRRSLELTADLFQAGLANYTQVLDARESWLASINSLTDSQQALTTDLIAIYKALGGDW